MCNDFAQRRRDRGIAITQQYERYGVGLFILCGVDKHGHPLLHRGREVCAGVANKFGIEPPHFGQNRLVVGAGLRYNGDSNPGKGNHSYAHPARQLLDEFLYSLF